MKLGGKWYRCSEKVPVSQFFNNGWIYTFLLMSFLHFYFSSCTSASFGSNIVLMYCWEEKSIPQVAWCEIGQIFTCSHDKLVKSTKLPRLKDFVGVDEMVIFSVSLLFFYCCHFRSFWSAFLSCQTYLSHGVRDPILKMARNQNMPEDQNSDSR